MKPKIFDKLEVELYLHCRKCYKVKPKNQSISEYARVSVGRTSKGLLIWCERHEEPVAHLAYDWSSVDEVRGVDQCECKSCERK